MALASGNYARIDMIARTGLANGNSVSTVTNTITRAVEGLYRARGFNAYDQDLALLVYCLGGLSLLYAVSKALGLPSISSVKRNAPVTKIMPSVGHVTSSVILRNMHAVLGEDDPGPKCGWSLMIDEISVDERACWMKCLNSVGGLCREHSQHIDLTINNIDSLLEIAEAVTGDWASVHFGKEATVAGFAPFRDSNYGVRPVLCSLTCKAETADESADLIALIIKLWDESPDGRVKHGPLWSIASDGDATRRKALYDLLMQEVLDPLSELYAKLHILIGLNLFTGKGGIHMDYDLKHLLKRKSVVLARAFVIHISPGFCTLLCSVQGLTVNNVCINHTLLETWLIKLPDHTPQSIQALINPNDKQDVPRAIELLTAVISLRDASTAGFSPSDWKVREALVLTRELFHSIMEPFINRNLSLLGQVTLLSKYAHLAFALYRQHTTSFVSNQLYGDSQATVKGVMFYIAKQQLFDSSVPSWLCFTGDDRLEALFGRLRMLGGHDPNVDHKVLTNRLGAAIDIGDIFCRNPELDKGPRRLKFHRTMDLDHLKPHSWLGDITSRNVRLKDGWDAGRNDAMESLKACKVNIDFLKLFAEPLIDLSRPLPGGKYPGVSDEPDRSQATGSTSPAATTLDSNAEMPGLANGDDDNEDNMDEDDDTDILATSVHTREVCNLISCMPDLCRHDFCFH